MHLSNLPTTLAISNQQEKATYHSSTTILTMSSSVALIFGAGANIGAGVARAFAANGYKVAVASRSSKHGLTQDDYLHLTCDLDDPSSVTKAFEKTRQALGAPGVVVYNGMSLTL